MKRTPLLVDHYLASKSVPDDWIPHKVQERVRAHLLDAKRFVLDDVAAAYVGDFIDKLPAAIAFAQEFAIPPFPTMYVELPIRPLWRAVNHTEPELNSDTRVGYLIKGPRVYTLSESPHDYSGKIMRGPTGLMPFIYRLHQPGPVTWNGVSLTVGGFDETRMLDPFYWGTPYRTLDPAVARSLRAEHGLEFTAGRMLAERLTETKEALLRFLFGSAGDLRNIIALLLFLNQSSKLEIEYDDTPPKQALVGNKARTLLRHSVVRLRIDPAPRLKRIYGAHAACAFRREHDVRGHFCHDHVARARCDSLHDWTEVAVNRWRCLRCGGLRWWKRAHRRGRKEKGQVKTKYEVTASSPRLGATQ